eukprot:TRINITY_DN68961_c0_g1_i1.p1 TRINITY_DN68961_c0_g1~~TRINITY_DN68961_c0_g1_i1.p1  ORF type:complete len:246 (-),score=35.32 TRINITY_DN68961_c0_g1_i1:208-945(-)
MAGPPSEEGGLKVILCGDCGVGKSNLMLRFTTGTDYTPVSQTTLGAGFGHKYVDVPAGQTPSGEPAVRSVKALIWDTAGQEKYRSITQLYYRGANAALLVYDVTKVDTFEHIESWFSDVLRSCGNQNIVIALVGNKVDLVDAPGTASAREVPTDRAQRYAARNNLLFWETSAVADINVAEAFEGVLARVVETMPPPAPPGVAGLRLPLDRLSTAPAGGGTRSMLTPEALSLATPRPQAEKKRCCS